MNVYQVMCLIIRAVARLAPAAAVTLYAAATAGCSTINPVDFLFALPDNVLEERADRSYLRRRSTAYEARGDAPATARRKAEFDLLWDKMREVP
jgi:hypothetical protein